ncbi:UBX domain-containing protein 4-like [Myzus persicae]|uniref:UBX domain-containing protein 4-like n=1 Tax=Myzus persicae TaxID=13164 RepID=UPI000B9349B7|nr:UBX domain-containing protein 4-like [Myzus persicae]
MSSMKWFEGDSKAALQQMTDRNCAFLIYIGNGNDDLTKIFDDTNIIQLLNNELILCYKMDPLSPSFKNFKDIFNNVVIPSIYLLEKNNTQQYIINKKQVLTNVHDVHLDLKRQLLNAICSIIKDISDTIKVDDSKQKYLQYLTDITKQLQLLDSSNINAGVQKVAKDIKKYNSTAKIKFKVPYKDITIVKEFPTTSTLRDISTYILSKVNLSERGIKFIAHRQFTGEDFNQTLEALNLCPSSTIYVHLDMEQSNHWLHSLLNYQSWPGNVLKFIIINPFTFIQHFLMSFVRPSPSVEAPRTINHHNNNKKQTVKKSTYKSVSNIHQLKTHNSDDDENNTYNGNSTQQL